MAEEEEETILSIFPSTMDGYVRLYYAFALYWVPTSRTHYITPFIRCLSSGCYRIRHGTFVPGHFSSVQQFTV